MKHLLNTDLMLMASVIGKCRSQEQVKQYFATTNPAYLENQQLITYRKLEMGMMD